MFRALTALALYAGLVVCLTWPLAAHIGTHLPAGGPVPFDVLHRSWELAYEIHALVTDPGHFRDANIYYPAPRTLFYGDVSFGALPYFAPTFLLTGNPALAANLLFLGCVALTAWTLHLVVVRWTGSELAGFVAASTLLTTRWVLWYFVPTTVSNAVLQYFPLIVFLAASRPSRFTRALPLVPLVVLQCLVDFYVAVSVMLPLSLIALGRLLRPETRAPGVRLLGALGLAALTMLPVYLGHVAVRLENPRLDEQTMFVPFQPPTPLPWGPLGQWWHPAAIPLPALLLIVAGALKVVLTARGHGEQQARTAWAHGAFWATAGLLISLTPTVTWYQTPIRLPQALMAHWALYRMVRNPTRVGIASLMGLSILAGLAFAECTRWLAERSALRSVGRPVRLALAVSLAVAMYFLGPPAVVGQPPPRPYPLMEAITPDSPIIRALRQPGGPVLEVPVGTTKTFAVPIFHARAMYRSIFHWRPLLNGYHSFWPAGFPERMALAARLPDAAALDALRREAGLDMIVVHLRDLRGGKAAEWDALAARGGREDLRLVVRDGDDLLFAVGGPPPGRR